MEEVAILGVGLHPWGKFPEKPWVQMAVEAAQEALEDAGLEWTDVEAVVSGSQLWGGRKGIYSGNYTTEALGGTGIPVVNVNNACATGGVMLNVATTKIASGQADIVLAVSADKSAKGFFPYLPVYHDEPVPSNDTLRWNMGLPNPAYWAFEMRKRMIKYGDTEEHLAKIKNLCSKHGSLNPKARYRKVFSVEDVLNSPMVTDPLRLLEICATSDGAGAVIIGNKKAIKKSSAKPIYVAASATGTPLYGDPTTSIPVVSFNPKPGVPLISESYMAATGAYKQAGIGPEDIDFVEIADNSSWHFLQYLETMGFCKEGECHVKLDEGYWQIGGKLPVCPSGGFASFGEATMAQGFCQFYELVKQLRGVCGDRQVEGAKVGMAEVYGAAGNNAAVILKS